VSWLASAVDTLASISCSTAAVVIRVVAAVVAAVAVALAVAEDLLGGILF
ncbi:hypothetical protein Tco_1425737, partial [Tanacetum coccineum]